ncbi:MAG: hypothetical protein M1816_007242 [Peltula sp. TS41687]|nr:MAG: hypothetical protein M1816_007242 [Peltula sp. TS41687]
MILSEFLLASILAGNAFGSPLERRIQDISIQHDDQQKPIVSVLDRLLETTNNGDDHAVFRTGLSADPDSATKQRTLIRRASGDEEIWITSEPEVWTATQEGFQLGQAVWLCIMREAGKARVVTTSVTKRHKDWETKCLNEIGSAGPKLPEGEIDTLGKRVTRGKYAGYKFAERLSLCVTGRVNEWIKRAGGVDGERAYPGMLDQFMRECAVPSRREAVAEIEEELRKRTNEKPPSTDTDTSKYTVQSSEKQSSRNPSSFLGRFNSGLSRLNSGIGRMLNSVQNGGSGGKGAQFGTPVRMPQIPAGAY